MKTTDPQDELFPIVDENDNVVGKMLRKVAHKSPNLIHRAIAVFIVNQKGDLLLQKRSLSKDTSPRCWTYSVGGHVEYEEDYKSTALREIEEEVGISVSKKNLEFVGKTIVISSWEQEMTEVYKCTVGDKTVFKQNKEEIDELRFVSKEKLKKMIKKEKWTPAAMQLIPLFFL